MSEPLPTMTEAPISVILTGCASTSETIDVITAWRDHLNEWKRTFEIVVVGPESNGELTLLRDAFLTPFPQARVVTYAGDVGDGPALTAAIAAATHPLLVFSTGDKQYHPKDAETLLKLVNEVDIACGYRLGGPLPGWLTASDFVRRVGSRILLGYWPPAREGWLGGKGWRRRWTARWIYGLRLQDVECRLRVLRRKVLDPFSIQSRGSFAWVEMLAKVNHLGCLMAEAPVTWVAPTAIQQDAKWGADARAVFRHPQFHDPSKANKVEPPPPASDNRQGQNSPV